MPDYKNGKIYKLVSNETDKVYIGSTIQALSKRKAAHKEKYAKYLLNKHRYVTAFEIVKHDDCLVVLLENYPCENKEQLHRRERYYIESMNCVNKVIPIRTKQELKEASNIKHVCECGGKYTHKHKSEHFKTERHKNKGKRVMI